MPQVQGWIVDTGYMSSSHWVHRYYVCNVCHVLHTCGCGHIHVYMAFLLRLFQQYNYTEYHAHICFLLRLLYGTTRVPGKKINVLPLTAWFKVWVNRLYVTVCAFIHLGLGTLLYSWTWQAFN